MRRHRNFGCTLKTFSVPYSYVCNQPVLTCAMPFICARHKSVELRRKIWFDFKTRSDLRAANQQSNTTEMGGRREEEEEEEEEEQGGRGGAGVRSNVGNMC